MGIDILNLILGDDTYEKTYCFNIFIIWTVRIPQVQDLLKAAKSRLQELIKTGQAMQTA